MMLDCKLMTADEIFARPREAVPWPSTGSALAPAVEILPMIVVADDRIAELVEDLALELVAREEQLASVRELLAEALAQSNRHVAALAAAARQREALVEENRRYARQHCAPSPAPTSSGPSFHSPQQQSKEQGSGRNSGSYRKSD